MHRAQRASVVVAGAVSLVLVGCGPAVGPPSSRSPDGDAVAPSTSNAATPSAATDLVGAWEGDLIDPTGSYPIRVVLDGCATDGEVCGELEYGDPAQPGVVLCGSELTRTGADDGIISLAEQLVYHPWMCLETSFAIQLRPGGGLEVEQLVGDGDVCCRGTLESIGTEKPVDATPERRTIEGLGPTTSGVALGGATTQYVGTGGGSLWFPLEDTGIVARVHPTTGAIEAWIETGDPAAMPGVKTDPHAVVGSEAGVWVGQSAARSIARIDPATNGIAERIPLPVVPYALALDGTTLWVTSFEDDRVVRVDLTTGTVAAEIAVPKPSGIAVGLGGVWVVEHRHDALARIDVTTNAVVAEISLGERGPNEACGMCVENVVVSDGSLWTANNEGRTVSRVDPATNRVVATIRLPLRPWAVTAGGGGIWASQFEGDAEGAFVDPEGWAIARIDRTTNAATSFGFDGALSVTWADDALWVVTPGRRGDVVVRLDPDD